MFCKTHLIPQDKKITEVGDIIKKIKNQEGFSSPVGSVEICVWPDFEYWKSQYLYLLDDNPNLYSWVICPDGETIVKIISKNPIPEFPFTVYLNGNPTAIPATGYKRIVATNDPRRPEINKISQSDIEWWVFSKTPELVELEEGFAYYEGRKISTIYKTPDDEMVDIFIPDKKTVPVSDIKYEPRIGKKKEVTFIKRPDNYSSTQTETKNTPKEEEIIPSDTVDFAEWITRKYRISLDKEKIKTLYKIWKKRS